MLKLSFSTGVTLTLTPSMCLLQIPARILENRSNKRLNMDFECKDQLMFRRHTIKSMI